MEDSKYKCSSKEHENIEAISYCLKCVIYVCNKCEIIHSKLCQNHQIFKLDKRIKDIFTGYCTEANHNVKLEFYCKSHNKLCCALCLCKIKDKGKGQHNNCDVCTLENIEKEKKENLKNNILYLENLSKNLNDSIDKLKSLFVQINESKEKLKLNIQNEFTKLRSALNEREDQLLLEVDNLFDNAYFDENLLNKSEKLPNKVKISLDKGKEIDNNWNKENLNLSINECINIENNIKIIEEINDKINKSVFLNNLNINYFNNEKKEFLEIIKKYGVLKVNKMDLKSSFIIKDNNQYINDLIEWINPKNAIDIELLYRKSRDGDSYDTFHKLCDNKGKTLILIKGLENFIIGAYTPINWNDTYGGWLKDDETFLFSLTNKKVYRKKEKSIDSIYCYKGSGPWFGGIGFRDSGKENMTQGEFAYSRSGFEFYGNINDIIPNEGKSRFFDVEEVEIYKLNFD